MSVYNPFDPNTWLEMKSGLKDKKDETEAPETKKFSLMFHIQADVVGSLDFDTTDSIMNLIISIIKGRVLSKTNNVAEIRYANCEILGIGAENV